MRPRAATPDDLPRILAEEARARADRLILGWSEARHRAALGEPDVEYRVYEDESGWLGFVILELLPAHRCAELTRIVTTQPGRGIGRAILRDTMRHVFETLRAHRLWLTSFADNARAHRVYRHLGFVEEGVLRESARRVDGFQCAVIFAMLEHEWHARKELA
jgi:RimJ/RimL family protein N-acetyltransferase